MLEKILGVVSVVLLGFIIATSIFTQNSKNPRTISLTTQGVVKVKPNSAKIAMSIDIESEESIDVATQKLINKRNELVSALKNLGLNDSDIVLEEMRTNQWDRYNETENESEGKSKRVYNVIQYLTLRVTKENFGNTENIITALGKIKDTFVLSIDKNLDSQEGLIAEARKDAAEKAKKQAEDIANSLGAKLGKILSVTTDFQNYGSYIQPLANMAKSSEEVTTADAQWFEGEDEYTTTLSFTFELR